jgi:hypothetical protein
MNQFQELGHRWVAKHRVSSRSRVLGAVESLIEA